MAANGSIKLATVSSGGDLNVFHYYGTGSTTIPKGTGVYGSCTYITTD